MKLILLILIVLTCTGCASAVNRHQALQHQLDMPINCHVAHHQINSLENERVSGSEKLLNGLASLIPTSAIINLLSGEYRSRWQIANGSYNKQADTRIAQIEETCASHAVVNTAASLETAR